MSYISNIDRAEKIIEISKKDTFTTSDIISVFALLCVPFDTGEKLDLIRTILSLSGIYYEDDPIMGIFIKSKKQMKKVIVSHIDLIPLFNKGFKNSCFFKEDDEKVTGALDNTITNAALILSILINQDANTSYLFTIDEESKQDSMKTFMEKFGTDFFVINLDVTNEGVKKGELINNSSVEYDYPCFAITKQLQQNLDNAYFTSERFFDDLDKVIDAGGYGLSYCLPTGSLIHSYKNFCFKESILPYFLGLEYIIHSLEILDKEDYIDMELDILLECERKEDIELLLYIENQAEESENIGYFNP